MSQAIKRGQFITLEGIEGAGKSTVLPLIMQALQQLSIEVLVTREPGGTKIAEQIREVFLAPREEILDPITELLLVFAGRNQHVKRLIEPTLKSGTWVISDRFTDATYAYQGGGRGLSVQKIASVEQLTLGDFHPDHTILLDLPVSIARERILERKSLDRIEREDLVFFERIRSSYLACAAKFPKRDHIIDATQTVAKIHAEIIQIAQQWVGR